MRGTSRFVLCIALFVLGVAGSCSAQTNLSATPQNPAVIPFPQASSWWATRHLDRLKQLESGSFDLVMVGDSITQNYEKTGPPPDEVFYPIWQEFFGPHHALNLGYSGDQTQNVLWRLQHGEVARLAPKDVVLLIGTNNTVAVPNGTAEQTAEQVTEGVIAVVEDLHTRLPHAKILVIGILPSGISEAKSTKDAAVNAAVRARYQSSSYARTLDLSSIFLKAGELDAALFYDPRLKSHRGPLHPDSAGQRLMAKAICEALYLPPAGR